MAATGRKRTPRFETGRSMRIAGLGGRFGNHNRAQIPALWQRFGPRYFGRVPGQVDRKSYGVCSNMDENGDVDYLAGVEVAVAPQRYAVFPHEGHVPEIGGAWMNIFEVGLPGM